MHHIYFSQTIVSVNVAVDVDMSVAVDVENECMCCGLWYAGICCGSPGG